MKKRKIYNWEDLPLIMGTDMVGLMLSITPNMVTRLCKSGVLPCFRVGKFWRFEKSAIRNFIEGGMKDEAKN